MSVYDSIDPEQYRKLKDMKLQNKDIAEAMGIPQRRLEQWVWRQKAKKSQKTVANKPRRCKECVYRSPDMIRQGNCSYMDLTGKMRGCPAEGCTKFEKGPRKERKAWELQ